MKIKYNSKVCPKGFRAINLFGTVFVRSSYGLSETTINHEAIHTAQMKELLYILFYIWYGIEWLIRLIQYRDAHKAYRNIFFEREAYTYQNDNSYLKKRRTLPFLWVK